MWEGRISILRSCLNLAERGLNPFAGVDFNRRSCDGYPIGLQPWLESHGYSAGSLRDRTKPGEAHFFNCRVHFNISDFGVLVLEFLPSARTKVKTLHKYLVCQVLASLLLSVAVFTLSC